MTKETIDELRGLFAALANVERLDDSGEPNTLSLVEIQEIGGQGLDLLDSA